MSERILKRPANAGASLDDRSHGSVASRPSQTQRLSVKGAANYTGLSCSTLNKLRCSGGGPRFAKIGRRVIYNVADLDTWLEQHLKTSTSSS
jgi:excisionase family DNA binding protein